MASTSTHIEDPIQSGPACDVLTTPPSRQLPDGHTPRGLGIGDVARTYADLGKESLVFARLAATRAYQQTGRGAARSYDRAARMTKSLVTRSSQRAQEFQRDYPIQSLAVVAGIAFLAGIAGRFLRSRAYEHRSE
jgi:ElaB/YqjD/DUF883 family membrane-anchored ribosome-binding protein